MLLECLTGRYPFDASGSPMDLIIHVSGCQLPLPAGRTALLLGRGRASCGIAGLRLRHPSSKILNQVAACGRGAGVCRVWMVVCVVLSS